MEEVTIEEIEEAVVKTLQTLDITYLYPYGITRLPEMFTRSIPIDPDDIAVQMLVRVIYNNCV